jgi:hypothetical protein
VMDGLDTYIDDYGKPDPLPEGMLRKLLQSHVLGLFDHEKENEGLTPEMALQAHIDALAAAAQPACGAALDAPPAADTAPAAPAALPAQAASEATPSADLLSTEPARYENTALQLQPHDGAGRPGAAASARQDPGCAH